MTLPPLAKALGVSLLLHGTGAVCWWHLSPATTHRPQANDVKPTVTLHLVEAPELPVATGNTGMSDVQAALPLAAAQSPATPPSCARPREAAPVEASSPPSLPQAKVLEQTNTQNAAVAISAAAVTAAASLGSDGSPQLAANPDGQRSGAGDSDAGPASAADSPTGVGADRGTGSSPGYLVKPAPDYPEHARRRGWQGTVLLEVSLNTRGEPISVRVKESSGFAILDEAAVKGVKQWRFEPARVNNWPQRCSVEVPICFRLGR